MAAKNAERYLSAALDSITAQTFQNYEIIVVDGDSSDDSLRIAQAFGCCNLHFRDRDQPVPRCGRYWSQTTVSQASSMTERSRKPRARVSDAMPSSAGQTGFRFRNVSMSTSRLRISLRGMEMRAGSGGTSPW